MDSQENKITEMSIEVIGGGTYLKNKPQSITITWNITDENGNILIPDKLSVNNISLDPHTTSKTYHRVFSDVDFTVRAEKDGILAIGKTTARFVGPTQTVEDSLNSHSKAIAASANSVRKLNEKIEDIAAFKGLFTSLSDLQLKLRSGKYGDWAIVGTSIPAPIYVWSGNGWEASGGNYTGDTVTFDDYYTKDTVAEYTDDYNVSKNHTHVIKIYDTVNWTVVDRDPDADTFVLGSSYNAGDVVNMTDDSDSSYQAINDTVTAPYVSQEVNTFTLEEAISFLPDDLQVAGQKISFYNREIDAWMCYVFTGGDYTDTANWEIFTNNIDPDTNEKIADLYDITDNLQDQIDADVQNLADHISESDAKFEEIDNTLEEHEDRMDDIEEECLLSSVEAACSPKDVEILADRAYKDHLGNVIADEYITRDTLTEEIIAITNQQVTDLAPGSVTPEDLSEAVIQMIGHDSITNLPDEEDLTVTEDNLLKFKDRTYSAVDYSGMGKKTLRKNYINGVNVLTQDMITEANTIYVIRYDYCLMEQEIEIPENCILQFDGGSLRNGTIEITESSKLLGKYGIEDDIIFQGQGTRIDCDIIKLKSIYNSNLFNSISSTFTEIIIPKRVFTFNEPIYWGRRFSQRIIGQGNYSSVFYFPNSDGIILDGVNYMTVDFISIGIESDGCCIKSTENCITISECNFYNCSFLSINNYAISNFYKIYRDTNENGMCVWYNSSFNECECTSWNENYACFDGIFNWSSSVICNKVTDSCRHPSTGSYDSNFGKPKCFLHNSQIVLNGCNLTNTHMDYILIVDFDVYTRNKIAFYAKYCNFEDVGISIIKCDESVRIDLDFQNNYVSKLGGASNANILNMFDCTALNIENLDYPNYKNIYVINRANCNASFIGNKSKLCLCFIDSNNSVNLIMPFTGLYTSDNDNIKRYQSVPSALTDVINDIRDNVLSKVNNELASSYISYSVVNYEPKTSSVILPNYSNTTIAQLLDQYGLAYNLTTRKVCVKDYNDAIRTVNDDYNWANNGSSDNIPDISSLDVYRDFGLRYSVYGGEFAGHLIFNGSQGFKKIKITDIADDIGTTADRPTDVSRGFQYFDYTLNKPIWWSGTQWVSYNDTATGLSYSVFSLETQTDILNIYLSKVDDGYYLLSNDSEDSIDISADVTEEELLNALNIEYDDLYNMTHMKIHITDGSTNEILNRPLDLIQTEDGVSITCDILTIAIRNNDNIVSITLNLQQS